MQKTNPTHRGYYEMICASNKNPTLRHQLVAYARKYGKKPAARQFGTTVKTVRKWVKRFDKDGVQGLEGLSRKPHYSPNKTPKDIEKLVLEHRSKAPCFGARRLIDEFELPCRYSAVHRIIKQHGLARKRRKRYKSKLDLRHIKQFYKPFTRFQMDVKHLYDIPHYWPQMKSLSLPLYQHTIRELSCGAQFLCYSTDTNSIS
jgi:transposase